MSCLIFGKHRANIARLRDGSEGRIGKKESGAF
jgi:glycerol-3-phosphate acyltransferase PlsY